MMSRFGSVGPATDGHQDLEGQQAHDLDVTMADSTVAFGNIMCLNDLSGGAVTPPPCTASVPIPSYLAKAIEEDVKASSGVTGDHEMGASRSTTRPPAGIGDLCM